MKYNLFLISLMAMTAFTSTVEAAADAAPALTLPQAVIDAMRPEDRQSYIVLNPDKLVGAKADSKSDPFRVSVPNADNVVNDTLQFAIPNVAEPVDDSFGASISIYGSAISIDTKSGPFHGVYSKPGFAYEEATIHLPSGSKLPPDTWTNNKAGSDTVYIYMGGETKTGGAVDAGFQHSSINDDWILFLVCEGFGFHYDEINRFASNQDVKLRFYIPADNYIVVSATGKSFEGDKVTRTVVLDVSHYPKSSPPAPNGRAGKPTHFTWRADGDGVILKRMTSIAQAKQSFSTKSYTKYIRWTNVMLGETPTSAHPWYEKDTGALMNWPDCNHVVVTQQGNDAETVNIYLNK